LRGENKIMHGLLKISLQKIKSNWLALNGASNGKAAAVIKANSYGLGMIEIAKALIDAGCNYFYVANITEAINLRQKFSSKNINIAVFEGFFKGNELIYFENQITPIINNLEQLKRINNFNIENSKLRAILNIDTGMNRLGLSPAETNIIEKNRDILNITKWDFIMSHLTSSNNYKNNSNKKQYNHIIKFSNFFPHIKLSLANTGGIKLGAKYCLDQTRPGIGIYGIDNNGQNLRIMSKDLELPFELFAPIIQIRNVDANEPISYEGIDVTKRKSKLATIGLGYADGWIRLLKPNSSFSVYKKNCDILGNITMDSFVLDITNIKKTFNEGDYICLLDNSNVNNIVKNSGIISYELLTLFGSRIIREYN
jgi:alanine racemase